MEDLGMVTLILLIGVGFALYVGGPSLCTYKGLSNCEDYMVPGFFALLNMLATWDLSGIINVFLFSPISGFVAASAFGIITYGAATGNDIRTLLGVVVAIQLANLFLVPFAFYKSVAGTEIVAETGFTLPMFIIGVLNLLMVLAFVSFILERRF